MLKMVATMKRKPGLSQEEFRAYYETMHTKLTRIVAECVLDYRRSYPVPNPAEPEKIYNPSGSALADADNGAFDCMTEVWLKDKEALRKLYEIMAKPDVAALFEEDTKRFVDRSTSRFVICEECRGWPD